MATQLFQPRIIPPGQTTPGLSEVAPNLSRPSSATPDEIVLGTLNSPAVRLRATILLEVSRQGHEVHVWSPDTQRRGVGGHLTAAIVDLQRRLIADALMHPAQHSELIERFH